MENWKRMRLTNIEIMCEELEEVTSTAITELTRDDPERMQLMIIKARLNDTIKILKHYRLQNHKEQIQWEKIKENEN